MGMFKPAQPPPPPEPEKPPPPPTLANAQEFVQQRNIFKAAMSGNRNPVNTSTANTAMKTLLGQ